MMVLINSLRFIVSCSLYTGATKDIDRNGASTQIEEKLPAARCNCRIYASIIIAIVRHIQNAVGSRHPLTNNTRGNTACSLVSGTAAPKVLDRRFAWAKKGIDVYLTWIGNLPPSES